MPRLIKAAIVCGAVPLAAGTLIYLMWRFTGGEFLIPAGIVTIGAGLIVFLIGIICLLRQPWDAGGDPVEYRRLRVRGFFALVLLLINFPMAALYTFSAMDLGPLYTVRVHNEGDRPIESLVVTGPGALVEFGPIAPGGRVQQNLRFEGAGTLDFKAHQQGAPFNGKSDAYVTRGVGGAWTIRVKQNGHYESEVGTRSMDW